MPLSANSEHSIQVLLERSAALQSLASLQNHQVQAGLGLQQVQATSNGQHSSAGDLTSAGLPSLAALANFSTQSKFLQRYSLACNPPAIRIDPDSAHLWSQRISTGQSGSQSRGG